MGGRTDAGGREEHMMTNNPIVMVHLFFALTAPPEQSRRKAGRKKGAFVFEPFDVEEYVRGREEEECVAGADEAGPVSSRRGRRRAHERQAKADGPSVGGGRGAWTVLHLVLKERRKAFHESLDRFIWSFNGKTKGANQPFPVFELHTPCIPQ